MRRTGLASLLTTPLLLLGAGQEPAGPRHGQGVLVGEPGATHALLQTRLTAGALDEGGDLPGVDGVVVFELSTGPVFEEPLRLGPLRAVEENDHVVRARAEGLAPGTRYHWRVLSGTSAGDLAIGPSGTFRTLPGAEQAAPVSFAVVTGMNHHRFHVGDANRPGYDGPDKARGYPALEAIAARAPDFVVFTGDNVYYDTPVEGRARTLPEMRRKWHEQLALPRFRELFAVAPAFWMKDDHDHRFNDCDTTGERAPSSPLGIAVFREQVPIVEQGDDATPTWRTVRAARDLQLWFVEGRDHRSPNGMEDGPEKTLWGVEQRAWLERTLLASDAAYRVLVSPTPLVGPDDGYKADNHTNPKGFRHEGEAFLGWAAEHGLPGAGFVVLCGDRHWQYHSIHPSGVEEFSCGALVDANSRRGREPGDPRSTDTDGLVRQPYTSDPPSGGFLEVRLELEPEPRLVLEFFDERGRRLHRVER